jgi:hypothetical protein
VRPLHAEALAQAFWGMFFAYSVISVWLHDEPLEPELSMEEVVALFVDIFVGGTAARGDYDEI